MRRSWARSAGDSGAALKRNWAGARRAWRRCATRPGGAVVLVVSVVLVIAVVLAAAVLVVDLGAAVGTVRAARSVVDPGLGAGAEV